jgi:hypothetical protein
MYAFNYDPHTGEYVGSEPTEYDQREPGRILLPGSSTLKTPPAPQEGMVRVFDQKADAWSLQPVGRRAA